MQSGAYLHKDKFGYVYNSNRICYKCGKYKEPLMFKLLKPWPMLTLPNKEGLAQVFNIQTFGPSRHEKTKS